MISSTIWKAVPSTSTSAFVCHFPSLSMLSSPIVCSYFRQMYICSHNSFNAMGSFDDLLRSDGCFLETADVLKRLVAAIRDIKLGLLFHPNSPLAK